MLVRLPTWLMHCVRLPCGGSKGNLHSHKASERPRALKICCSHIMASSGFAPTNMDYLPCIEPNNPMHHARCQQAITHAQQHPPDAFAQHVCLHWVTRMQQVNAQRARHAISFTGNPAQGASPAPVPSVIPGVDPPTPPGTKTFSSSFWKSRIGVSNDGLKSTWSPGAALQFHSCSQLSSIKTRTPTPRGGRRRDGSDAPISPRARAQYRSRSAETRF